MKKTMHIADKLGKKALPIKRRITCKVTHFVLEPLPIAEYLAGRFTYYDINKWQEEIAAGRFFVNQRIAVNSTTLSTGDEIEYRFPPFPEPQVQSEYSILHEDDQLLVVDKPANLPCHPRGRYFNNTLWALLKRDRGGRYLSFINRLDRETSGLVLLAKDRKTASLCQQQFKNGEVGKKYRALVRGLFPDRIEIAGFLSPDQESPIRHKQKFAEFKEMPDGQCGKKAETIFRLLQAGNGISLIEALPKTGRQHQIRATLEFLGYPLLGDKIYGCDAGVFHRFIADRLTPEDEKRLFLRRHALHAAEIRFKHPWSGDGMMFASPLPEDFEAPFETRLSCLIGE